VYAYSFGDLPADRLNGIEGRHRFLENNSDFLAANTAECCFIGIGQVLAIEPDVTAALRSTRQQSRNRQR